MARTEPILKTAQKLAVSIVGNHLLQRTAPTVTSAAMPHRKAYIMSAVETLYLPVLVIGGLVALVVPIQLFTSAIPHEFGFGIALAVGTLSAPLFIFATFDRQTRAAINDLSVQIVREWPSKTWQKRFWSFDHFDLRLLTTNRILLLEFVVCTMAQNHPATVVAFSGFMLTGLLQLLLLGRGRKAKTSKER